MKTLHENYKKYLKKLNTLMLLKRKQQYIFRSLKDIIYMNQNFTDYWYFCSQKYGIYMIQNL